MPAPRPSGLPCKHAAPGAPICAHCAHNRARVKAWALAHPGRVVKRYTKWARRHKRLRRASRRAYTVRKRPEVSAARRARSACTRGAAPGAPIDVRALWKRDEGTCGICGRDVPYPFGPDDTGPQKATIDHIVPASQGGAHDGPNVRLAHSFCNSERGAPRYAPADDSIPF